MSNSDYLAKEQVVMAQRLSMTERLEKWRGSKMAASAQPAGSARLLSPNPASGSASVSQLSAKMDKKFSMSEVRDSKPSSNATPTILSSKHVNSSKQQQNSPSHPNSAEKIVTKRDRSFLMQSPSSQSPSNSHEALGGDQAQNMHPNYDDSISPTKPSHNCKIAARRSSMLLAQNSLVSSEPSPRYRDTYPSFKDTPDSLMSKKGRITNGLLSPSADNGYSPDPSLISSVRSSSEKPVDSQRKQDMEIFMKKYIELKQLYLSCEAEVKRLTAMYEEKSNQAAMAIEEVSAMQFLNSVQEQRIAELEDLSASNHIKFHENNANRQKKYKSEIVKLKNEKIDYEERANSMIQQMSDQMSTLQSMAMSRIQVLENELLESRRKTERLEGENYALMSALQSSRGDSIGSADVSEEIVIDTDMDDPIAVPSKDRKTMNRRRSSMLFSSSIVAQDRQRVPDDCQPIEEESDAMDDGDGDGSDATEEAGEGDSMDEEIIYGSYFSDSNDDEE